MTSAAYQEDPLPNPIENELVKSVDLSEHDR